MLDLFKKKSEVERRLKSIRKEMSSVNSDLSSLSRTAMKSGSSGIGLQPGERGRERRTSGRFSDYFATSFEPGKPLRRERRIQRNKAIVLSVFVLMLLFWILYRFFL